MITCRRIDRLLAFESKDLIGECGRESLVYGNASALAAPAREPVDAMIDDVAESLEHFDARLTEVVASRLRGSQEISYLVEAFAK